MLYNQPLPNWNTHQVSYVTHTHMLCTHARTYGTPFVTKLEVTYGHHVSLHGHHLSLHGHHISLHGHCVRQSFTWSPCKNYIVQFTNQKVQCTGPPEQLVGKWYRVRFRARDREYSSSFSFFFFTPKFAYVHGDHMQFRVLLQTACHIRTQAPRMHHTRTHHR